MARSKRMQSTDPTPLRKSKATGDPSPEQEAYLAAFLAACVIGYTGVYVTRYTNSGAIKLRLYIDGDSYEDVLETNEEWGPLFDDYSTQAGVRATYQAICAAYHAGRAGSPAEAPGQPETGERTPLRARGPQKGA